MSSPKVTKVGEVCGVFGGNLTGYGKRHAEACLLRRLFLVFLLRAFVVDDLHVLGGDEGHVPESVYVSQRPYMQEKCAGHYGSSVTVLR